MAYEICRTPNGRFYMHSNGTYPGYRCSPYFKSLDEMVARRIEIQWNRRKVSIKDMQYGIINEYSSGMLPFRGPDLQPHEIPEWMRDIQMGDNGRKPDMKMGDSVYFEEPDNFDRIKGVIVEHLGTINPNGIDIPLFGIKTDDPRFKNKMFEFYRSDLWKAKS